MVVLLAACVTSFLVSFIILPVIIKYTLAKNILDMPGRRKIHKKVTPSMGGIAIFAGFLMSVFVWMDFEQLSNVHYLLASLFLVFLLGVRDDIVPFRASHKLYGQIVAVVILMFSSVLITSLYGFLGIEELPAIVSYVLTAFTIILVTNSFNLIDGLDGLAGSVGLVALVSFGTWFFLADDFLFSLLSFSMAGGILAFLVYNWEPSEIFMGDTGAMVIGMLLAVLSVHFMSVNDSLSFGNNMKYDAPIAGAISFIIIPLTDTLRIIILRLSKGQSPFAPDKSHIHHAIMRLGMTHAQTAIILAAVNALFVIGVYLFRNAGDVYLMVGIIAMAFILSFTLDRLILRKVSAKSS
jgi:UDP-N-acetylmuramyl pentapeptide phosphotransferase/UDP-N-acetylglucosamine-1-phosphate transferase